MKYIFLTFILVLNSCTSTTNQFIKFDNPSITYEGRIQEKDDAAVLSWSGSSVSLDFVGTEVSASLKDLDTANYYNVILDDKVISKFHSDTIKKSYLLATGLENKKHRIEIFKRTEWDKGKTLFYGFELDAKSQVLERAAEKKRKIEFYGNSITSAYANEDYSGLDRGIGYFQNNYEGYAAITARYFDAQFHCISKSGIGVMISWFPFVIEDIYDKLDPTDENSQWDFSKYNPDIIVVNLFQNDSWLVNRSKHQEFIRVFGKQKPSPDYIIKSYANFISTLREKYPNKDIICALGNMDATREGSEWPSYIEKAVESLEDNKLHTCFFKFKNTGGHPNVEEQHEMANQLIEFIEENIEW